MVQGPDFMPRNKPNPINVGSTDQLGGIGAAIQGIGSKLSARHEARQMRDHQMNMALAHALGQIHTAEATVRVQALKNEGEIALQQGAHEQELKMAQEGRHTIRTQADADIRRTYAEGLEARAKIASEAIAARGEAEQGMDFAERMADKGHEIDFDLQRGTGVRIKATPRAPQSDPEGDLAEILDR
jgi:hypothetical protein